MAVVVADVIRSRLHLETAEKDRKLVCNLYYFIGSFPNNFLLHMAMLFAKINVPLKEFDRLCRTFCKADNAPENENNSGLFGVEVVLVMTVDFAFLLITLLLSFPVSLS